MTDDVLGWDVGGAHLKLAQIGPDGALKSVAIAPCRLWRGLGELDAAIAAVDAPDACASAVTMTGELVDLWPDRRAGVAALVARLSERFGAGRTSFYAGEHGFLGAEDAVSNWSRVASANWRATAEALAAGGADGLLVDVGSTTTDLVPFAGGEIIARGATDAERMAAGELIYLGVARTPVMALAAEVPFGGAWIRPMAEHFATTADLFRLAGDLAERADLHPAADSGPKTAEASARRLLRMVGADLDPASAKAASDLAAWLAETVLRRLFDGAALVLSRPGAPANPVVYGAGVGRFLALALAGRLGLVYRDLGAAFSDDAELAVLAADSAPAVSVARLLSAARQTSILTSS